ncbi:DUF6193 family natural product biosynthesis protein [Streptomyces sp. NPDC005576]|uniref:DUF6193 family natural product biosynthesis protein n=1 Tax=Streptomyces sp. NPDC005576 TaxID=3364726 RepID=UPI0036CDFB61
MRHPRSRTAGARLLESAISFTPSRARGTSRRRQPSARRGNPAVIEAAHGEPRLRVLLPFPSHGCLTFHRNSQFPWSNDLPFIAGSAPCTVYGPLHSSVLEEGLTPKKEEGGSVRGGQPAPRLRAGLRRAVAATGQPRRLSRRGLPAKPRPVKGTRQPANIRCRRSPAGTGIPPASPPVGRWRTRRSVRSRRSTGLRPLPPPVSDRSLHRSAGLPLGNCGASAGDPSGG